MENKTNINWYPGHMAKAIKQIEQDLKLVDIVIEILDARIPISSQNPEIKRILNNKKRIIILNKCDLASDYENKKWKEFFENIKIPTLLCDSAEGKGIEKVEETVRQLMNEEINKAISKGRVGRPIRVMIVGIPNVGKSSFINRISKKSSAQVGNKPGVTKQKQWIKLHNNIELLDTPGVLWPKIDNELSALNLAYTGTIKNEILEETEVAYRLVEYLLKNYKENLIKQYKINEEEINDVIGNEELQENEKIVNIMEKIALSRGIIGKGGNVDLERVSKIILDDFKNGRIGKITLERID